MPKCQTNEWISACDDSMTWSHTRMCFLGSEILKVSFNASLSKKHQNLPKLAIFPPKTIQQ